MGHAYPKSLACRAEGEFPCYEQFVVETALCAFLLAVDG